MRRLLPLLAPLCAACALAAAGTPALAASGTQSHTKTHATTTKHTSTKPKKHKRGGTSVTQGNAVLRDCSSHGQLTHPYTKAQLRKALQVMSPSTKQYSNCQDVIQQALLHQSGPGKDTGGGGSSTTTIIIIVVVVIVLLAVIVGGLAIRRRRALQGDGTGLGDPGEEPTRARPPDEGEGPTEVRPPGDDR